MTSIIGRNKEIGEFNSILSSTNAHFLGLYGRRRVGKTYLVREFFKNKGVYFELVGLKGGTLEEELTLFRDAFQKTFYGDLPIMVPPSWYEAFSLLTKEIKKNKSGKIILFFDELPWLATPKSGFLEQLDHFWNVEWSQIKNLILIVCGSAASWMLENLIYAKGGLHNRLTRTFHLLPFNLKETKEYLKSFSSRQILEVYMGLGGVPYYLQAVKKSFSAAQNINHLCFEKDGLLVSEFKKLFSSLFGKSDVYTKLAQEIAQHRYGILRERLLEKLKVKTGGRIYHRLDELKEAGFIASFVPYGKKTEIYYRISDEFVSFYFYWMKNRSKIYSPENYWIKKINSPSWYAWAGYTFETICLKHVDQIAKAIGISNVSYEVGNWRTSGSFSGKKEGSQIDLLFDREDGIISLCEIKMASKEFILDRKGALELEQKKEIFLKNFKTKKQILWTLITPYGIKKNPWSEEVVSSEVKLDDLFAF